MCCMFVYERECVHMHAYILLIYTAGERKEGREDGCETGGDRGRDGLRDGGRAEWMD